MDRAFEMLVTLVGLSPVDAATMCATTPARELGLVGHGVITHRRGRRSRRAWMRSFAVVQTYIAGRLDLFARCESRHRCVMSLAIRSSLRGH